MTNIFDDVDNTSNLGALKLDNLEGPSSPLAVFYSSVLTPITIQSNNVIAKIINEVYDHINQPNHAKGHANGCFSKNGGGHTKACFSKSMLGK